MTSINELSGNAIKSDEVEERDDSDKYVKLIIKDQDDMSIEYRVKKNVTFGRILESYAKEIRKNKSDLRLTFKGKILGKSITPFDLRLEDGNEIEVVANQTGG